MCEKRDRDRYREALQRIVDHGNRGDISAEDIRDLMAAEAWSALRETPALEQTEETR